MPFCWLNGIKNNFIRSSFRQINRGPKGKMKEKIVISHLKGAFGNQLFQYATGYSMAKRNGAVYKLDLSFYNDEK